MNLPWETMATNSLCFWGLFLSLSLYFIHSTSTSHVYIVYLGISYNIHDPHLTSKHHVQLLSKVFESEEDVKPSMLYSYKHSFSGFSAKLNSSQATTLAKMEEVISVFRSKALRLHTTRSWDFLGLTLSSSSSTAATLLQLAYGEDIIVGIFDTGIWPESDSFREEPGMRPIPSTWKGMCIKGEMFEAEKACNRKLIGARYYLKGFEQEYGPLNMSGNPEYRSARDLLGHGTHTASTAVGSISPNASFFGLAEGTARGGAPRARVAVYKVCWGYKYDGKCCEADILAAFDDALHDGVHVISASFGSKPPLVPLFVSEAAIGSFHAMQLGVTVVFSAGNEGPDPSQVTNVSPWGLCVAASSVDRMFSTRILLDNNLSVMGESFITTPIKAKLADATTYFVNGICRAENWIKSKSAVGRVILCFSSIGPKEIDEAEVGAKRANATGLIFVEAGMSRQIAIDIIPSVHVNLQQGTQIKHYLAQSPTKPVVQIEASKSIIGKSPAPRIAYFSSRGPSSLAPDILKPDISAPGINILAAWPPETSPTLTVDDKRSVEWNFQSGTSMSCPHVSGVVALIKSAHPTWSPAAIKSALMTTAYTRDTSSDTILADGSMKPSDPFDLGAGHIHPIKAMDPGLVYDMKTTDYILFLCNIGYTQDQINRILLCPISMPKPSCPQLPQSNSNLNYPSITVSNLQSTVTIKRSVRNVGHNKNAIYFAAISEPDGVEVVIWPRILIFSWFKEENTYYVTLKPRKKSQGRYDFGQIVWSDGFHKVRSPLLVSVNTTHQYHDDYSTHSITQIDFHNLKQAI